MAELSNSAHEAIMALVCTAPDAVLEKLALALRSPNDDRFDPIRRQVVAERAMRRFRAQVFGPIHPMFRPRADGVRARIFPAPTLNGLWKAVKARHAALVDRAEASAVGGGRVDASLANQVAVAAAAVLRDDPAAVWSRLDRAQGADMAAYFDLAPLARQALPRLRDWTDRPTPESLAALRLLFRDAAGVAEDSAPRLTEILFANITEAPLILRVVGGVAGFGVDEHFLAGSELADFGERLFEPLERVATEIRELHAERATLSEARRVAAGIGAASDLMRQMELSLGMSAEGDWGGRFQSLKLALGEALGRRLGLCEKAVDRALPMERVRFAGAMTRLAPRLDAPTDGPHMEQARVAMLLLEASRDAAAVFGCERRRIQVCDLLIRRLSGYGDQLIETLNAGDADEPARLEALAALCAGFLDQADAGTEAHALRRRLAAAGVCTRDEPARAAG